MSGKNSKQKRYMIWSNVDLDPKDWVEAYRDYLEINDMDIPEEIDENDVYEYMEEANWMYLEDERSNLSHLVTEGEIVAIAELGFWNGTKSGYKLYGTKISDCLSFFKDCDCGKFYVAGNDLKSLQSHHDGSHFITFRELKPNFSQKQVDNFLEKIYNGTYTSVDVTKYTRSIGKQIKAVYGWK